MDIDYENHVEIGLTLPYAHIKSVVVLKGCKGVLKINVCNNTLVNIL